MSSGPVRRVSPKDIQVVQNLIERCLQLYMNQSEVVETLLAQAKIEPGFTELVWQKLEEENREFFRAYYLRLMVKHQIIEFNKLLEQQVRLMHQLNPTGVAMPTSNGSHIPLMHQNSTCYAAEHSGPALKAENIPHPICSSLPNAFTDGGTQLHSTLHSTVEMSSVHGNRNDTSSNMLSMHGSSMGLMQGINGGMIKSETGCSSTSPYMYGASDNILEARSSIADASVASLSSVESNTQGLNEPLLDADISSFGFLGQIPRNFSLSDLTADFAQSSDILENYSKSPFLATDDENFLQTHDNEHQGENTRLDTISEGVSYDDFGSESL